MSEFSFNTSIEINDFQIPGNNVIIKGVPQPPQSNVSDQTKLLQSKIELLEKELQNNREDAYKEGFEACRKTFEDESNLILDEKVSTIYSMKIDFEKQISEIVTSLHRPILELGSKIAEKILCCELKDSDSLKKSINSKIKNIISKLGDQINLNIKMHPECFELINKSNYIKNPENGNKIKINFTPDESLKYGECIVESEDHIFDGRFISQIENIISSLN